MPGPVLHMAVYPGPEYDRVPRIGEYTTAVLDALGVTPAELAELASRGVIGPA